MLVLLCFCVATEFSVNIDLYIATFNFFGVELGALWTLPNPLLAAIESVSYQAEWGELIDCRRLPGVCRGGGAA